MLVKFWNLKYLADWLFHGSIYCWNPSSNPSLSETRDHRPFYPSQKASNYPEPTDRSSFGRVQIYHQNRSSVLRSRVNRLVNIWTEKLYFSIENRSSNLTIFLQCRWSFRRSSRPPYRTFLFMQLCLSCRNGNMFACMIRLVKLPMIEIIWTATFIISILPKRMSLNPVSETIYNAQGPSYSTF